MGTAASFTVEDCFPRRTARTPGDAAPRPDHGGPVAGHHSDASLPGARRFEFAPLDAPSPPSPQPAGPATGGGAPAAAAPRVGEAELAAAVAAARREGFAAGEAAGRAAAEAEPGAERERALARLIGRLAADGASMDEALECRAAVATELALVVARAVVPAALARLPLADVETMLRECLGALREQPALELALAPALVESGEDLLREAACVAGLKAELAVVADPALAPGDARLRWREGEAERDVARLAAEVEALVRRRLDVMAAVPVAAVDAAPDGEEGNLKEGDEP